MSHKILLTGAAVAILSAVALSATASTEFISQNTWYTAQFGATTGTFVFGGVHCAGCTGNTPTAVATTSGSTDWSVTLTSPESLTVLDAETSGDQFEIFDNGVALGNTTTPVDDFTGCGENISCALGNSDYSRGVFGLHAGANDITIKYLGVIGDGSVNFFVGAPDGGIVPEPASWALMLAGFAGLGAALRGRRKALASPA